MCSRVGGYWLGDVVIGLRRGTLNFGGWRRGFRRSKWSAVLRGSKCDIEGWKVLRGKRWDSLE